MNTDSQYLCTGCYGGYVPLARWKLGYSTCLPCGDLQAKERSKKFTVLTPHKQGAMYFTAEFAREAAKGINNKGGLIK